jgi:hypothetical protein
MFFEISINQDQHAAANANVEKWRFCHQKDKNLHRRIVEKSRFVPQLDRARIAR